MLEAIRERYGFEEGDYLVLETQGRGPDRRKGRMIQMRTSRHWPPAWPNGSRTGDHARRHRRHRPVGPEEVVVFDTNGPVSAASWQGQSTSSTNV
jgi:hypothetical protein